MSDFIRLVIYKLGAALGMLFFTLLIAYLYPEEVVVKIFSFTLTLYLLSIASRNGLDLIIVKNHCSIKNTERPAWLGNIVYAVFILSTIYGTAYYFLSFYLWQNKDAIWITVNLFPFSSLLAYSFYFRAKNLKFLSALVEHGCLFFIVSLFICASQYAGSLIRNPIQVLTMVNWIFNIIILLLLIKLNLIQFKLSSNTIKNLVLAGTPFMALAIAAYVTLWIPAFIIKTESSSAFIDYNIAIRLLAPVTFIINTVDFYLSTHFSEAKEKHDSQMSRTLFLRFRRFYLLTGLGYIFIVAFLLYFAVGYFDQINYRAIYIYTLMLGGYFISSAIGPCGILLNMYGNVKYTNYATVTFALFIVIFSLPALRYIGLYGIVCLVAMSIILRNAMMLAFLKHRKILH